MGVSSRLSTYRDRLMRDKQKVGKKGKAVLCNKVLTNVQETMELKKIVWKSSQ